MKRHPHLALVVFMSQASMEIHPQERVGSLKLLVNLLARNGTQDPEHFQSMNDDKMCSNILLVFEMWKI